MKSFPIFYPIVRQRAPILELFTFKNKALLIGRDALFILNF